jgi:PAS domain S-box-containing protein
MVSLSAEKLTNVPLIRLVHVNYQSDFMFMFEKSKQGKAQTELVLASADGKSLAVYLSGSALEVDGEIRIFMIVTDITKRVQAENALKHAKDTLENAVETLQESQAKYLDLYENANDIIFTLDLMGNFTSANRTAYRELGYSKEDIVGKHFLQIFTAESTQFASLFLEKALMNNLLIENSLMDKLHLLEEQTWEFEAETKEGLILNLEVRARFICDQQAIAGVQCIARNITERKQVEMELSRLATAIEQAVESVLILDKQGKIQYANTAFFRISGYNKEEVLGKSPAFLKSNRKDDETFYRGLLNTVSTKSVWTGRIVNRKKDGSIYEAETTISPVRDKAGKIVNYVAVERDVTEEVKLESQLRQMQKMEAIGTLAGGIAHDFNNILSAIIGFAEMSIEDIPDNHPAKHFSSQILKAAVRGRDLVRQILMFSHKNEEERKHFRLSLMVKEAMKLMRASLPSTIEIRQRMETEMDVIFASPTQVHQVLMNLCTNAGHAMRIKGGILEVSLTEFDAGSMVDLPHPGMAPGPYLKLSVSDTGTGMDKSILERIFDPFFTTKSPTEGTGMGLAVVHGIVKTHGGEITVRSIPGRGSVFDVYFPRSELVCLNEVEPVLNSQKGTERILLIDDEDALVEMGESMLKRLGYHVRSTKDSLEALDIFRSEPEGFDLIITDQTMPRMTGTELAQEVMAVRKNIPVILCSGYSEMVNREQAKELGIREFIMKPVSRNELAEAIRRVLDA